MDMGLRKADLAALRTHLHCPVEVSWLDAKVNHLGWVMEDAVNHEAPLMVTLGYLLKVGTKTLTTCSTIDAQGSHVTEVGVIPIGMVERIVVLAETRVVFEAPD